MEDRTLSSNGHFHSSCREVYQRISNRGRVGDSKFLLETRKKMVKDIRKGGCRWVRGSFFFILTRPVPW